MTILQFDKSQAFGQTFVSQVQISHGENLLTVSNCYLDVVPVLQKIGVELIK